MSAIEGQRPDLVDGNNKIEDGVLARIFDECGHDVARLLTADDEFQPEVQGILDSNPDEKA